MLDHVFFLKFYVVLLAHSSFSQLSINYNRSNQSSYCKTGMISSTVSCKYVLKVCENINVIDYTTYTKLLQIIIILLCLLCMLLKQGCTLNLKCKSPPPLEIYIYPRKQICNFLPHLTPDFWQFLILQLLNFDILWGGKWDHR